jgi:protease-4
MSNNSDNLAALIYLKDKLHKWKNITFFIVILFLLLLSQLIFGGHLSGGLADGDYIANIKIDGVIFENDYRSKVLNEVAKEKSIKAVIINIDSPGGSIVGSEILFNDLSAIAKNKPIVVLMNSVAASGGYMAAVASDYIIAHNGTLTGSIGVLMQAAEVTDLAQKVGVKFNTYKSSPLKGSPSPFEKSSFMVDSVIKESISDSYKFFSELVEKRRANKLNKALLKEIFDGRVFTGRQALQAGLIDEIGSKETAIEYLLKKLNVKDLPVEDVEITEHSEGFMNRFFNIIPFFNDAKSLSDSNSRIMAIMR